SKKKSARKDKRVEALKHPLAVVERFLELQVDIPTTSASIGDAIERLNARRKHFVETQSAATTENKRKAEEKIAKLMAELDVDEKMASVSTH
ncbi:multicopy suppressor of BFA (Brefeldin A), partial [Coemansia aciculifera]